MYELLNELGKKVYHDGENFLKENDLFSDIDTMLLEMYAWNVQQYFTLAEQIKKEGIFVTHLNKTSGANPKLKPYYAHLKHAKELASMFGFTPLARKKLKFTEKKSYGDFRMELLKGL
jgi:P27 family predicted phage terminase small subunit